jgi:beta-glucosidase
MRFGIVHVDYETQERTPKRSALAFKETLASR